MGKRKITIERLVKKFFLPIHSIFARRVFSSKLALSAQQSWWLQTPPSPLFPSLLRLLTCLFPILLRHSYVKAAVSSPASLSFNCPFLHTINFSLPACPVALREGKILLLTPEDSNKLSLLQPEGCKQTVIFVLPSHRLGYNYTIVNFCWLFLSSEDILRFEDALYWPIFYAKSLF